MSSPLELTNPLVFHIFPFYFLHVVINLAMSISVFSIADWQAFLRVSFNPDINWLILALGLAMIVEAYLDNLVNLSEYSLTVMLPCRRFMNSLILASLSSRGKK